MEVKVSFDSEKLVKWYNECCGIECEDCPLDEYICDILSSLLVFINNNPLIYYF